MTSNVALERSFKELWNGHGFFTVYIFSSGKISQISGLIFFSLVSNDYLMLNGSYLTCCGKGANSILRNVPEYWYFSGNTWKCVSMATNHHGHYFVSSYSKYESLRFICHPNKNSLVFPSWRHSLCIEMDCTSMAIFSRVLHDYTSGGAGKVPNMP